MSSLWQVEVIDKHKDQVRLDVQSIHTDADDFTDSKAFALLLLADSAFDLNDDGEYVPNSDLGSDLSPDFYEEDEEKLPKIASKYIASVEVSNVKNSPFDEGAVKQRINQQLKEKGIAKGTQAWEQAFSEQWSAFWSKPGNRPSSTYTIRVTEPRWIAHLKPGKAWESAAYAS